jgi:glycosyltransferase involved in cell wall biosynthesis
MRIVLDITRLTATRLKGRVLTGIDRVAIEYVRRYGPWARAMIAWGRTRFVLSERASAVAFARLAGPAQAAEVAGIGSRAAACKGRAQQLVGSVVIHTGHFGLEYASFLDGLRSAGARSVVLVHDLIPIEHPQYCPRGSSSRHAARIANTLRLASGIVTNSKQTLRALERHAGSAPLPPMISALLAPACRGTAGPVPLPGPYFVVIGTIEPRKNHALLLRAWHRLVESLGESAPHLVVIGSRGREDPRVRGLLDRTTMYRGRVIEINGATDDLVATYLQHARALLMPSFAEGYGLPVVEALATGIPVLASALPVYREVAGDIPEYLDPDDSSAWLERVRDYAADGPARRAQMKRLAGFRPPTWAEHFARVDELLECVSLLPCGADERWKFRR